jgi:hypothetical protein
MFENNGIVCIIRCVSNGWLDDGPALHLFGGMVSGICAIITSFPLDVVKTRMINQGLRGSEPLYSGMFDCLVKTIRQKGFFGVYQGCLPAVSRQMVMNSIQFVLFERLLKLLLEY